MEKREVLFTNKDLKKLIIPLIIEQLLTVTVGLADSIMISSVGEAAVSGVSLVDSIMILLINMFSALATGGSRGGRPVSGTEKACDGLQDRRSADLIYLSSGFGDHGGYLCYERLYPSRSFWGY